VLDRPRGQLIEARFVVGVRECAPQAAGLVQREASADDRRWVTLTRTAAGRETATLITEVEERLYERIDELTEDTPVDEALLVLRQFAEAFPAGQALARRADRDRT
jgi:hypothetical protein